MFTVKASVTIHRPIADVFAFIADNENDPHWCVPVLTTTRTNGGEPRTGAHYHFSSDAGFFKPQGTFQITSFEPPGQLAWEGISPFHTFHGHYKLTASADAVTELTESVTFHPKGIWRLFAGRMESEFNASYERQLQILKELLEDDRIGL